MALSNEEIKAQYPLPAYNYRVTILTGSYTGAGILSESGTVISCSEVSGLHMEIDTVTYKHGFSFITGFQVFPGQSKEVHLTIRKGVTANSRYFSDWMNLVYPALVPLSGRVLSQRDILVDLCDEAGQPVVRWVVLKAMPVKLEAPSFDANTNEVAFERLEFIAHQLKVSHVAAS
jgi:phage tail-like protein